ncbi:hypothetical protein GQR58_016179 [Nymphon striatum]|nr:hypothetical protein GQR58_016179 [Nymphon striatum]
MTPKYQSVAFSITEQKSILVEQVMTGDVPENFEETRTIESRANQNFVLNEGLLISEVEPDLKESNLLSESAPQTKEAIPIMPIDEATEHLIVSETQITDITDEFSPEESKKDEKAGIGIVSHIPLSVSEVLTDSTTEKLSADQKPVTRKAEIQLPIGQHITVSESLTNDSSESFVTESTRQNEAQIDIEEMESITISEVNTEMKETEFEVKELPARQKSKYNNSNSGNGHNYRYRL